MSDTERKLVQLRNASRQESKSRIAHDSKERLKKIATKKFRTCFISALAEFENVFGLDVWGHGLPDGELTPAQLANRQRWEQVRKHILDKGNTQSRALVMEIDLHSINFEGYKFELGGK